MEVCQQIVLYIWIHCILAGQICCMLVYFHNYFEYDRAYDLCRRNNMRLLRVDSEDKLQSVTKFAEGLKNFTMPLGPFRLSLRYDVNSSQHLWPDGTVNTLTTAWDSEEPLNPETLQCVGQKNGKWTTRDCGNLDKFICETGYSLDPVIETDTFIHYPIFRTFRRLTGDTDIQTDQLMSLYKAEENVLDMYRGFRVCLKEECAVWCTMEPVCAGITFTTNKDPQNNVCILLK